MLILNTTLLKNRFMLVLTTLLLSAAVHAQQAAPDTLKVGIDTVKAGIYITSIHDINFKDKEYTVDLWLWLKYKNKKFDFVQNLEVPQAKTVTKSFSTIDSTNNRNIPAHEAAMCNERFMGDR